MNQQDYGFVEPEDFASREPLGRVTLLQLRRLPWVLSAVISVIALWLSASAGRFFGLAVSRSDYFSAFTIFSLSLVLATLNFSLLRAIPERRERILSSVVSILVAILSLAFPYLFYGLTPPYIVEGTSQTATALDVMGRSGHMEATYKLRIMKNGISEIPWGGLGSTGAVKNISFRAPGLKQPPELAEEAQFINLEFLEPFTKGQRIDLELEFDITESEADYKVSLTHVVTLPTRVLQLNLVAPKEHPCKSADAVSEDSTHFGRDRRSEDAFLFLLEGDTRVFWAKTDPTQGRTYMIVCSWRQM